MPQTSDSPLTPLGQQILAAHPARRQASEFSALSNQFVGTPPWLLLVWFVSPLGLFEIALSPIMEMGPSVRTDAAKYACLVAVVICFGAIALQASVLNCYVAFSADPWWQRMAVSIPLVIFLAGAGLFGMWLVYWYREWDIQDLEVENGLRFCCALPLVVLSGVVPLIFFRWVFAWSLVRNSEPGGIGATQPAHRPASILNMLLLTAVIAGGFGLIRVAPVSTLTEPVLLWVMVAVLAAVSAGFSLFGALPLTSVFHYVQSYLGRFLIGLLLLLVTVGAALGIMAALSDWDFFVEQALFNAAMFGGIVLTYLLGFSLYLLLLSACGWVIGPASFVKRAR